MIVGEAQVEIKAVTSRVRREIKDGFERGAQGVGTEVGQEFDKELTPQVDKTTTKVTGRMRREFSKAGSDSGDQFAKNFSNKIVKHFESASVKGKLMGAITAFIGPAAGLIGGVGGGLVALSADIASAAGSVIPLYSNMLTLVSALGAVKLATSGVGKALSAELSGNVALSKKYMAQLSPAAKQFVLYIKTLNPQLKALKQTGAEAFFPGVERGIKGLVPLLPAVSKYVKDLDSAVGNMVGRIGQRLGGPLRGQLSGIFGSNVKVVRDLTQALVPLADAFVRVLHEMGPTQREMGILVKRGAEWLDRVAKINQANGSMARYFQRSFDRAKVLGSVLHNLAATLRNVFHAAAPSGNSMLKSIDDTTARWAKFTATTGGQNTMKNYFQSTIPVMKEVVGIIGDAVKGIAHLGQNNNLVPLLQQIRTQLEPAIGRLLQTTTGPLASSLVTMVSHIADIVAGLAKAGGSGYIQSFVQTLDQLSQVLLTILRIPGLGSLAGILLGIAGSVSAVGVVAGKLKILKLLETLTFAGGTKGALGGATKGKGGVLGSILGNSSKIDPVPVYITNWAETGGGLPVSGGKKAVTVAEDTAKTVGEVTVIQKLASKLKIGAGALARMAGIIGFADLVAESVGPKLHSGGITKAFQLGQDTQVNDRIRQIYRINQGDFGMVYNPRQQMALRNMGGRFQRDIKGYLKTGDTSALIKDIGRAEKAIYKYRDTAGRSLKELNDLLSIHVKGVKQIGFAAVAAQTQVTKQMRLMDDADQRSTVPLHKLSQTAKQTGDVFDAVLGRLHAKVKDTTNLGEEILNGLIQGMRNRTPAAKVQAKITAGVIFKQLHLSGQFGSPSRITTRMGAWTVDGWIKGMRQQMPAARHAAQALTATIHALHGRAAHLNLQGSTGGSSADEVRAMRMDLLKLLNATERQTRAVEHVPHGIVDQQNRRGAPRWRSAELLAS